MIRRFIRGFAVLVGLGVIGTSLLLITLFVEQQRPLTLPAPTGPYAVGRTTLVSGDEAIDSLAPTPGTKRQLLLWFWYPAAGAPRTGPYLPLQIAAPLMRDKGWLESLVTRNLTRVSAHAVDDAPLASREHTYPVVLLRAGASAEIWNYTTLAEDLASHGYVVVGIDAPYRTGTVVFPDGRILRRTWANNLENFSGPLLHERANRLLAAWTADMSFVADRLKTLNESDPRFGGRLDLTRIGAMGHSFGGAQALQFCHDDPRCGAAIDLDGRLFGNVLNAGIDRPTFLLLADHPGESDPEMSSIRNEFETLYRHLPPSRRAWAEIEGSNHYFFSDNAALLKSHLVIGVLKTAGLIHIDGTRQLEITAAAVHRFFDANLKQRVPAAAAQSLPTYRELVIRQN